MYSFALERGETALIVVRQMGVDVVVDLLAPDGRLIAAIDSPTGRYGDEIVEVEGEESGRYTVRVHPYDDKEPSGKYELKFVSLRSAAETAEATSNAKKWLLRSSAAIPPSGHLSRASDLRPLQHLRGARVLGLGEATHGSREFADFRLSLTQRLIAEDGYRIVAVEGSASRFQSLAAYIRGDASKSPDVSRRIEVGWIGRRSQRELIEWVRAWNLRHRRDQVRLVGIDAQDNADSREILDAFLKKSEYGDTLLKRWAEVVPELKAADDQTHVFGDSGVNSAARQFLVELNASLDLDAPLLLARFGAEYTRAKQAAEILLEFADFNSDGPGGMVSHSRDWYMANRILRTLQEGGPSSRAIYWAHNSHVVHPEGAGNTAGGLLRQVLRCQYRSLALAFGQGAFVAQIPNDLEDKLAISTLPMADNGSIEALLSTPDPSRAPLATWDCPMSQSSIPEWLRIPRRMHWVGGLYRPGTRPTEAFRPFVAPTDFDGIVYFPTVTADEVPLDRPVVPARKR